MAHTLLFDRIDGVAILSLNRPEKYNSFNREMALSLQAALDECEQDVAVRCIVLTGTGKGFCGEKRESNYCEQSW